MPRLSESELSAIVVRNRVAADYLVSPHPQASLDDVLPLVHAYREAVALNARYRAALRWCLDEGGWRLLEYELSGPPPEGVFDRSDPFNPALADEETALAALRDGGAAGRD